MRVEVRLFAITRQLAGCPSLTLDLPEGASVGDLRRELASSRPELAALAPHVMIAVASEFVRDDAPIPPGAEIALIPPVSGGAPDSVTHPALIEITEAPIDVSRATDWARSNQAGAVCVFLGTVREWTGACRTAALEYEAYHEMALAKLTEIESEARQRWPILGLAIVHRVGRLELGEISVVIAVSCPHRSQAFEACQWLIDTLKAVVPIWKKELGPDGREEWIHPGLDPASGAARAN